ncbi:AraC family transcriptional regulator [Pseudochryseolinea flava]|uniref:AraC family transcriptional regulator n=1 Tax=Pseudochryseolinea flava TaxID=2059302 RepID=A0A364Y898_9BACT|nr:helix-turn-helix domain-containing protein [Pseudochryseolinea flava]RAW02705.1 AraC family transcriptional regulator [Pseudochryseolinea flava]
MIEQSYRIDLFAVFIFLGIVQAVFLSIFFFSPSNRKNQANVFHGIMLLSMAACMLEIFLMYTGYIVHCFYLVDFSESVALIIGPAFYLMAMSLIHGKVDRRQWLHFIVPIIYLILQLQFLLRGEDTKYNAWIYSYHPELPYREVFITDGRYGVTNHATTVILISLAVYAILGLIAVIKAFRARRESWLRPKHPVLRALRLGVFECISVSVLVLIVKLIKSHDTGDHLFAAYSSIMVYITSFDVMKHSGFFTQPTLTEPTKKYKTVLQPEINDTTLERLKRLMENDKPYKEPSFSLPDLAQRLGVSVHVLSQVINESLGKSFFEMAAEYRVQEAQRLLKEQPNIKVEEIAEQVGYMSKSSFNTAFKKITGLTPSEFRSK